MAEALSTCNSGSAILQQLRAAARANRLPLSGSVSLTHRCNFRCAHCYARNGNSAAYEWSTSQWLACIDEMAQAGCLFFLITGGEPLLREDFALIYQHAKEKGLLVTVFTNGALISDGIVQLFRDLPPRKVEVSLYGANEETYRRVTGVEGAHARCWDGVHRLQAGGIRIGLKSVAMTLNHDDIGAIQKQAQAVGAPFRLDVTLCPRLNGDGAPLALRLPPPEAVALEMSDTERRHAWRQTYEQTKGTRGSERLYPCGAGRSAFHVSPDGHLQACVMTPHIGYCLATLDFKAAWGQLTAEMDHRLMPGGSACRGCKSIVLCGYCPALTRLETGSETGRSDFLCALGEHRQRWITQGGETEHDGHGH
jgi:radical SAM protein with 4Fe4S-binding SPASM domain